MAFRVSSLATAASSAVLALLALHCGSSGSQDVAPSSKVEPPPAQGDAGPDAAPERDGGSGDAAADAPSAPTPVAAIAAGARFACALSNAGAVKCWGENVAGQLGLGDVNPRGDAPATMVKSLPTIPLGAGRSARTITAGQDHVCVLLDDGAMKCWGENASGQLGLGNDVVRGRTPGQMGDALPAIDLGSGRKAKKIGAGASHTCAILDDDTLKCWGSNNFGQLGLGDKVNHGDAPGSMGAALPAVDLGAGHHAVDLAVGRTSTCVRLEDATVKCWGANDGAQLGNASGSTASIGDAPGEMGNALPPVALGAGHTVVAMASGRGDHRCVLLDGGAVKCWGYNRSGQLGIGSTATTVGGNAGEMGDALPPLDLGGNAVGALALGGYQSCAIAANGVLRCWGDNAFGELGLGDRTMRGRSSSDMGAALQAIDLGAKRTALAVAAGVHFMCALLDDHSVKCWGDNYRGQLGQGDTVQRGSAPGAMGDALKPIDFGW